MDVFKDIEIPTSKSYINRLLILASLAKHTITIKHVVYGQDVLDLINILHEVGVSIKILGDTVTIANSFPECETRSSSVIIINSGAGGTTNRFALVLLAHGQNCYQLSPDQRLLERPMQTMWTTLKMAGVAVDISRKGEWPTIKGPLSYPDTLTIDTGQTTQVASAFLLGTLRDDCSIVPTNTTHSYDYYKLTEQLLKRVKNREQEFIIPYDFSSLGYLIAYGAVIREITIAGVLSIDSFQPDAILVSLLRRCGVHIELNNSGLTVVPSTIINLDLDCASCPDLVPTLAFIAAYAQGESSLHNIKNLQLKESDRITELLNILSLFGVRANYDKDVDLLHISGRTIISNEIEYHAPDDHRMALVAMLFMLKNSGGEINNFTCVRKSFPSLL